MKKLVIALTALAAFTGSASAADLGARPYTKAPAPVAPASNWTGFYIFGGGGGGIWAAERRREYHRRPLASSATNTRTGGDGWFGTVGAGYDWQIGSSWVVGIFGDGQFGSLKGNIERCQHLRHCRHATKMETAWAAGVSCRLSRCSERSVLRQRRLHRDLLDGQHLAGLLHRHPVGAAHRQLQYRNGWFVGGGVENNLNIFGINAPGWFMKTEYRAAYLDRKRLHETVDGTQLADRPATSPSSPSCRPSAPRWSTASTGVALRSPPSTDLC